MKRSPSSPARSQPDDLRLLAADEAHALDDLFGEQGGHAGVEGLAQVRQPQRRRPGTGCSRPLAVSSTAGRSPSFSTFMPVNA